MDKKAIILAAGKGTRLYPLTKDKPKCLVEVNRTTILENTLEGLRKNKINEIFIVVGYKNKVIENKIGNNYKGIKINYIFNREYEITNSMFSLKLGLESIELNKVSELIIIESDIFIDFNVFTFQCVNEINWFIDSGVKNIDGSYVEKNNDNLISTHEIIRDLSLINDKKNKSVGVLKVSKEGVIKLREWLHEDYLLGFKNEYYDLSLGRRLKSGLISSIDINGIRWSEIDDVNDLRNAKEIFR